MRYQDWLAIPAPVRDGLIWTHVMGGSVLWDRLRPTYHSAYSNIRTRNVVSGPVDVPAYNTDLNAAYDVWRLALAAGMCWSDMIRRSSYLRTSTDCATYWCWLAWMTYRPPGWRMTEEWLAQVERFRELEAKMAHIAHTERQRMEKREFGYE